MAAVRPPGADHTYTWTPTPDASPPTVVDVATEALTSYSRATHRTTLQEVITAQLDDLLNGFEPKLGAPATARLTPEAFLADRGGGSRFAHIVCDSFLGDSDLEGSLAELTAGWLIDNLEIFDPRNRLIEDLRKLQTRAKEMNALKSPEKVKELADRYRGEIEKLSSGERFLLPGGWTEKKGGHFILYEIIKEGLRYTLNVYNTGAGSAIFHDLLYTRGKTLIRPLSSFQRMSLAQLLGGDSSRSDLLQMLMEFTIIPHDLKDEHAAMIYGKILAPLKDFHKPGTPSEFATPQRSGTCAYSGLIAFLRNYMTIDPFKALQIKIKMQELLLAYNKVSPLNDRSNEGAGVRYMLKKGAEWLMSRLIKTYRSAVENPDMPKRELLQNMATVRHIQERLAIADKDALEALTATVKTPFPVRPSRHLASLDLLFHKERALEIPPIRPSLLPDKKPIDSLNTMRERLELISNNAEEYCEKELGRAFSVSLFRALPSPQDFISWNPSFYDANLLYDCLLAFVKGGMRVGITSLLSFEEKLVVFKLYALIHAAAIVLDRKANSSPEQKVKSGSETISFADLAAYRCHPQFIECSPAQWGQWVGLVANDKAGDSERRALSTYFAGFQAGNVAIAAHDKGEIPKERGFWKVILETPRHASLKNYFEAEAAKSLFADINKEDVLFSLATDRYDNLNQDEGKARLAAFKAAGLGHLALLQSSAALAGRCFKALDSGKLTTSVYSDREGAHLYYSGSDRPNPFHSDYYPDIHGHIESAFTDHQEAFLLVYVESYRPLQKEIVRATHSAQGSWHLIAAAMTEKVGFLIEKPIRRLFELTLLRAEKQPGLIADPSFLFVFNKLIARGLDQFYTRKLIKPELEPLLFLMDMALRVALITKTAVPEAIPGVIKDLLSRFNRLKDPPKGSRYFLNQLLLHMRLISSSSSSALCAAWMKFSLIDSLNNGEYTRHPMRTVLLDKLHDRLKEIDAEMIAASPADRLAFIEGLFKELGLPDPACSAANISYNSPLEFTLTAPDGHYDIALVTARLISPSSGAYREYETPRFVGTESFRNLFGEEILHLTGSSFGYEFDHPRLKGHFSMNLRVDDIPDSNLTSLYCAFPRPGFYNYKARRELASTLPYSLIYDHHHWFAEDSSHGLICDAKTNTPRYRVMPDGAIHSEGDDSITIFRVNPSTQEGKILGAIENTPFITAAWGDQGLSHVSYPRLYLGDETIAFKRLDRDLIATFDDRFTLSLEPQQGVWGFFTNYLYLQHRQGGKDRLLVPLSPVMKMSLPTPVTELGSVEEKDDDFKKAMAKTIPCCSFVLDDGRLRADSNAGFLYLTLLCLQAKEYEKALAYLQEFSPTDALDKSSEDVFGYILKHADINPNAQALILRAALLATTLGLKVSTLAAQNIYFNGLDKVAAPLKLSVDELLSLGQIQTTPLLAFWLNRLEGLPADLTDAVRSYQDATNTISLEDNKELLAPKDYFDWSRDTYTQDRTYWRKRAHSGVKTFVENHCLPNATRTVPWLTQISDSSWPGLFSLYAIAKTGNAVQKALLGIQIRCYLERKETTITSPKKGLLGVIVAVLNTPEDFPDMPPSLLALRTTNDIDNTTIEFMRELIDAVSRKGTSTTIPSTDVHSVKTPSAVGALPSHYMPRRDILRRGPMALEGSDPSEVLFALSEAYFASKEVGGYKEAIPTIDDLTISPEEVLYKEHIEQRVEKFCKEIQRGQELLAATKVYNLKEGTQLDELQQALLVQKKDLDEKDRLLTENILKRANKTGPSHETLELMNARRHALDIETLYFLFLQNNQAAFRRENNNLTLEEVTELQQMIFESLLQKTTLQHIDRLLNAITEGTSENHIGKMLADKRAYVPTDKPHYLVFEYFSQIRLYEKQKDLLEKLQEIGPDGHFVSKVGQMMMGGGKTKVLSALLLFASSRPDHIPMLVVPASLYNVVFTDLNQAFRANFNRLIQPIHFTREELTEDRAKALEQELLRAKMLGHVVLIKAETLQILRLQYLSEYESALTQGASLSDKGAVLRRLLNLLRKESDILIDEIHLVWAQKQEVNFPVGQPQLVAASYIDTMASIYLAMTSDPEMATHLTNDSPGLIDESDFRDRIIKRLSAKLLEIVALPPGLLEEAEILRYISGVPSPDVERKLGGLYAREKTKPCANTIALMRYCFNELMIKTFKRSCGRHFGPLPAPMAKEKDLPPGKIVPYQAVDTPATTVFASWAEEADFGFRTACRMPITREAVDYVFKAAKEMVSEPALIASLNEMIKKITTIPDGSYLTLFDLEDPESVGKALECINSDLMRRILFQAEFLKLSVKFFDERLSSNPQDWFLPSLRGLTGTPYNLDCYTGGLSDHYIPDEAVEGKIVAAHLQKVAARGEVVIHKPESTDAETLLRSLIREETKGRLHGLQDAGGIFKDQDNLSVATAFNKVIKEKKMDIEGTIFFWKKPGMATANQMAFLRIDGIPMALKGSTREQLREQGINPDKIFIYYDESRCTGTDIPQPSDSINFITIDFLQDITTTLQSILRERQFVTGRQEVEFVIPTDRAAKMPSTLHGIIVHLVKKLAIDQSRQFYQAMRQRIDAIFKEEVLAELLSLPEPTGSHRDTRLTVYNQLRSLYVEKTTTDPFVAYGRIATQVKPLEELERHIAEKWRLCRYENPLFRARVEEKLRLFQNSLTGPKMQTLPALVNSPTHTEEGTQVEVEVQIEQVHEREQVRQLEQELLQEHYDYNRWEAKPQDETPFPVDELQKPFASRMDWLKTPLNTTIRRFHEQRPYRRDYSQCFDDTLLISENFYNDHLPIFHRCHKPAHQILVEKTETGYRFMLISEREFDTLKTTLASSPSFWLIDDRGNNLIEQTDIKDDPSVQAALIQIAAFNGNAAYLSEHGDGLETWLNAVPATTLLKKQMVAIKAQLDPFQAPLANAILYQYTYSPEAPYLLGRKVTPLPNLPQHIIDALKRLMPARPSRTPSASMPLALRICLATISILTFPLALFALFFTLPFSREPFRRYWHWLTQLFRIS